MVFVVIVILEAAIRAKAKPERRNRKKEIVHDIADDSVCSIASLDSDDFGIEY